MKRRSFGLLSGSSVIAARAGLQPALAQTAPDPSLLTTTLTPMGGERAGNADGSIPAWTGGLTTPSTGPAEVRVFTDEQPLFTVDASNMDQHAQFLTPGVQFMMKNWGFSIRVFPTHRTACAPQWMYDFTAANVGRAHFPGEGRLGFIGAYGGVPFPIIDTADPLVGGAQVIWNHLCAWGGYSYTSPFSQSYVVTGGQLVLSQGGGSRFVCPYYDPKGSLETFDGYFAKIHLYIEAPSAFNGQEELTWHSTNVTQNPDITWQLLNGQGRVRKAPDEAYDAPNPYSNAVSNIDESSSFYGNPSQYDWKLIGKTEMYVPYNSNDIRFSTAAQVFTPKFINPDVTRWEKHRVWEIEATLHPGIRNVFAKRRFYVDEDSWFIMLGQCYDANDNMVKTNQFFNHAVPVLPGTIESIAVVWNLETGDYAMAGIVDQPPQTGPELIEDQAESYFEPEQMSANASF